MVSLRLEGAKTKAMVQRKTSNFSRAQSHANGAHPKNYETAWVIMQICTFNASAPARNFQLCFAMTRHDTTFCVIARCILQRCNPICVVTLRTSGPCIKHATEQNDASPCLRLGSRNVNWGSSVSCPKWASTSSMNVLYKGLSRLA